MKYMGSKRIMLANGLGEVIARELRDSQRFVDLFTGSAAVACHVACKYEIPVVACDLQQFSIGLARGIITRTECVDSAWIDDWISAAEARAKRYKIYKSANNLQEALRKSDIFKNVLDARAMCLEGTTPILKAYGGFYFSPLQSLHLDILRGELPKNKSCASIALAALIQTASRCSASPGHTAQPFSPSLTGGPFIFDAWSRSVFKLAQRSAKNIASLHALVKGSVRCGDAAQIAKTLRSGDLVFVDPPYSGVHYSRFYHVLETLTYGVPVDVSGVGRYPPASERPRSDYSVVTKSAAALESLLRSLSDGGCSVILTFPANEASNGLSGKKVISIAERFFTIDAAKVSSRFSTLGGNTKNRVALQNAEELILTLRT